MLDVHQQHNLSLHTLSHLMQSLLMRLQIDLYMIERLGAQESNQDATKNSKQYVERSRSTIQELSALIQDLFGVLYITNEPYEGKVSEVNLTEWWGGFKEPWIEKKQFLEEKNEDEKTFMAVAKFDAELVSKAMQAMAKAVLQWQVPGKSNFFELTSPASGELEFTVEFQPAEIILDSEPDTPRNETITLGAFYWGVAQIYATQLQADITSLSKAQKGKASMRWFVN